jgi:hypothetical protein
MLSVMAPCAGIDWSARVWIGEFLESPLAGRLPSGGFASADRKMARWRAFSNEM